MKGVSWSVRFRTQFYHSIHNVLMVAPMQAGNPVMLHNLKRDGELSAQNCFLRLDTDENDRAGEKLLL